MVENEDDLFALFIWIDDRPITGNVFRLSFITKPFYFLNVEQKRDFTQYKIGQQVEARFDPKCKKTARAIIGGIEDEANKETLGDVLRNTSMFKELVDRYVGNVSEDVSEPETSTTSKKEESSTGVVKSTKSKTASSVVTPRKKDKKSDVATPTKYRKDESKKTSRVPTPRKGKKCEQQETPQKVRKSPRKKLKSSVVETPTKDRSSGVPSPREDKKSPQASKKKVSSNATTARNDEKSARLVKPGANEKRKGKAIDDESPKRRKTDLSQKDLERIGEDLNLLNLVTKPESPSADATPKHVITPNLLRESLELVNQGEVEMSLTDILPDPPLQDHPHCREVIARFNCLESHIHWLTTNIQHLYQIVNEAVGLIRSTHSGNSEINTSVVCPATPSSARATPNAGEKITTPKQESMPVQSPPGPVCPATPTSSRAAPNAAEQTTSTTPRQESMPVQSPPGPSRQLSPTHMSPPRSEDESPRISSVSIYQGFTKDMLRNKIRLLPDYKKATAVLFRLLYNEEERIGHSLKGKKSRKDGIVRPGLKDLSKLDTIYELITEKWPNTEREQINAKIGHLLKPSSQPTPGKGCEIPEPEDL